jgi:vacuolar-type H+-ATPase subunit C/Vma6
MRGHAFPPGAGERAYAFAKACGIIGKSFVGKRMSALASLHSLNELDRLVFPDTRRELPGRELLADIEKRILSRTVSHILAVVNAYGNPPELIARLIRSWEYADLKTALHYFAGGMKTPPAFTGIGRFQTVRFAAFPDLAAMLGGTEFEFILAKDLSALETAGEKSGMADGMAVLEAELDLGYYRALVKSLASLSAEDRLFAEHIVAEEISLRNCIWALRLRTYFAKTGEETAKHLMDLHIRIGRDAIPGDIHPRLAAQDAFRRKPVSLAAEAFESLALPLDSRSAWRRWRWERFLNPQKNGEAWAADPRWFQNAASEYLYRLSLRCFRRMPFSISAVFCYIKLKQFEEDLLTSVAEGLGLGMAGGDVFELLEAAR